MDGWTQAGITVLGVVTAVSATEWCVRVRERRHRLEEATLDLAILLPYVTSAIWEGWAGPRPDTGVGSEWSSQLDRVSGLLNLLRVSARWPLGRARTLRAEVDDLTARLTVAEIAWFRYRTPLTEHELDSLTTALIFRNVFPRARPMDETIAWYRERGLTAGRPPARPRGSRRPRHAPEQ
jgi:hypothetical protein